MKNEPRTTELLSTSILVASHVSDLSGPTEALLDYLQGRAQRVVAVLNPLEYCTRKVRLVQEWCSGILRTERRPPLLRAGRLLTWTADFLTVLWYARTWSQGGFDLFVGCDCLNAAAGLLLRHAGVVDKVVYYSIDWTRARFGNPALNTMYHVLDQWCARHADRVWNVTRTMCALRRRQGVRADHNLHVPVGTWLSTGVPQPEAGYDPYTLVLLGALERTKGIELVLEAWPRLIARIPQTHLVVIGQTPAGTVDVPYETRLAQLPAVKNLGVLPRPIVLNRLVRYGIGLAPYLPDPQSVSYFGDPSRVKDYLSCGLPVVITSVPEIAQSIEAWGAGRVISYDPEALISAVEDLVSSPETYAAARARARALARQYAWETIFDRALADIRLAARPAVRSEARP